MARYSILLLVIIVSFSGLLGESLQVCGDINKAVALKSHQNLAKLIQSEYNTADLALLVAADGTAVIIDYSVFPFIEIIQQDGAWFARTERAPLVCNLNNLVKIILHSPLRSNNSVKNRSCQTTFAIELAKCKYLSKSYKNNLLARKYKLID